MDDAVAAVHGNNNDDNQKLRFHIKLNCRESHSKGLSIPKFSACEG